MWCGKAAGRLKERAEAGDAESQHALGWMVLEGMGAGQDERAGAAWVRKAADHGLDRAQSRLGLLLQQGRGVAKVGPEAVTVIVEEAR